MKIKNSCPRFFFYLILLVTAWSFSPVLAEEAVKITDAVNVFVYNPDNPSGIHPVFVGDTIPPGSIIYLADANSRVSFDQQGLTVVLDQPGFYNTSGEPIEVSAEVRAQIQSLAKAQPGPSAAETLIEDAEAGEALALYVNEPVNSSSPSN